MSAFLARFRPEARILILAIIVALGTMAIHMLVPALPMLADDLAVSPAKAQWTISIYLAGLAGGQLLAGPFADRLGRRPVILAGLACYGLSALIGAITAAFSLLVAARLLQAIGGAAGVVAARVMVGDLYKRSEAAGKQATLMSIVLISPAFAPVVGGALAELWGWRAVLLALALLSCIALILAWRRLPESRHQSAPTTPTVSAPSLGVSYARLFTNRRFLLTSATLAGSSSGLYLFLSYSPFLLIHQFGLSPAETGTCLLSIAVAGIVGTRCVAPIERRGDALTAGAACISVAALTSLLARVADVSGGTGIGGLALLMGPMLLYGLGAGMVGPAAINNVIYAEEGLAATATSVAGTLQMLASSLAIPLLGLFVPVDDLRLAIGMALATALALVCAKGR